jgi:hypothetical protein
MSALHELEAYQDGISSPFWQLFSKYITQEWGPSGLAFQGMYQAGIAAKNWEQVIAASEIQKAMAGLLQYPHDRVEYLKKQGLKELVQARGRGGI